MKRLLTVAFVFSMIAGASTSRAQSLTDEQIEQIIKEPPTGQLAVCFGRQQSMRFEVCASGPVQRVALAARKAKKDYRPFALVDVVPAMRADTWEVFAVPTKPVLNQGEWYVTPSARAAMFQLNGNVDAAVIRPIAIEIEQAAWSNGLGRKFVSAGFSALFKVSDLPAGLLDLIILTSKAEQRYTLTEEDRLLIR